MEWRLPKMRYVLLWASAGGAWFLLWIPMLCALPLSWSKRGVIFAAIAGAWYGGYLSGYAKGFMHGGRSFRRAMDIEIEARLGGKPAESPPPAN